MRLDKKSSFARILTITGFACCLFIDAGRLSAQVRDVTAADFSTASGFEDYLRVLQISGIVAPGPWSLRSFSQRQIERMVMSDSAGPWRLRDRYNSGTAVVSAASATTIYNTKFAYGSNDGPIWAGRALTLAASGGVTGRYGPVSYAFAPMAFWARNRWFRILNNGAAGLQAYNHGVYIGAVDLPQRFGEDPYFRVDPGQSSVSVDTKAITVGLSTANEWIGPATEHAFLLSNNAPGFPHLFMATGDGVNVWLARVHAKVMWGKLAQSDYSSVTGPDRYIDKNRPGTSRLMTSAMVVIVPRGIPGLEIGGARFFHVPFTKDEPSGGFWAKPLKDLFLESEYARGDSVGLDNQLASAFFRWAFPRSGVEVYGEVGHEDQFYDMREFLQNHDHGRSYMLGFQKAFRTRATTIDVIKGELINYQLPTIARLRIEGAVYLHSPLRQGHTNRGQLLGSSAGVGAAAASTISWNRYSQGGRTGITFRRIVRGQIGNYLGLIQTNPPTDSVPNAEVVDPDASDVIVSLGLERMRFGRIFDIGARVEAMKNYNHHFAGDLGNLSLQIHARIRPWWSRAPDASATARGTPGKPEALVPDVATKAGVGTSPGILEKSDEPVLQ